MTTKRALITGITGQDGAYLAEFLLEKEYEVHGMVRRSSTTSYERIEHLTDRVHLHQADLLDQLSLVNLVRDVRPHEIYNLAAQSFVPTSWLQPLLTSEFTALGVTRMLEAIRLVDSSIRFFQASSSEMFGRVRVEPQNEETPFWPRSPYAVAKAYGHFITVNYRESYDLFACSGIMFNHESPLRGKEFLPRKVSDGVARIKLGAARPIVPGQSRRRARLGFCRRFRPRHVAHTATRTTGRLCHRHRQALFGPGAGGAGVCARRAGLGQVRGDRPGALSPG